MEQQRLKRMPMANQHQQQQVGGPEAMHMVPGNMPFYNPNQFAPNLPSNGSYNPPHFHSNAQVKEPWHWDENTNTIPSYQPEPILQHPSAIGNPEISSANFSHQVPPLYGPGDNAPQHNPTVVYPPPGHHTANNNQHDSKSNQNWGDWNDQGWGWNDDHAVTSGHQQSQPLHSQTDFKCENPPEARSEVPQSIPLVTTRNVEQGMSSLSLSAPNQENEVPSIPAPPMAGHPDSLPWSQVPLNVTETAQQQKEMQSWLQVSGWEVPSVKKEEEIVLSQVEPEGDKYAAVLGERNTSADGASYTDGASQQQYPPQQPMVDPPAHLPPPNLEAPKPNFYLGSQQQPPSRPSSIPPLGVPQPPPATLASATRPPPMFQTSAGTPHFRANDGLQSLPPFPSDGTASSVEEPTDSPAPASLPPFIESHTPTVPPGPSAMSNPLPPPPRSAGLAGPTLSALNRGSPYVGGINGPVRPGLVSTVLPPAGPYSAGSQPTPTEAELALASPVPSVGEPRPPVLPSPVSNPTIFSPIGSVSVESVSTESTYAAPTPGSFPADSENAAINTDVIPSNAVGGMQRSQSGTPLLERESERPDAEGGYENDLPTPLANPTMYTQVSTAYGMERKVNHESPSGSRPASRQAGSTPSEPGSMAPPAYYPDNHASNPMSSYGRPKSGPGGNTYPVTSVGSSAPPTTPTMAPPISARGTQEAVGSEFRQPASAAPVSRASVMSQQQMEPNAGASILPPSSQRMIPGSGSQALPLVGPPPQTVQHGPVRTSVSSAPVTEQRIVTGYAKNDPPAAPPLAPASIAMDRQQTPQEETRNTRSPPPPHRSETIGSENPRMNMAPAPVMGPGNGAVDRAEDGRSTSDRDREHKAHENRSRTDRERERDRDGEYPDRERGGRNRYTDDDDDERYSTGYRDRRYDERDRRYDDRERRFDDRDRDRDRERDRDHRGTFDYDLDRSGYADRADRDRVRDTRRRDSRRSDYYLEPDVYGDRSGRRSSLYDGEMESATDFNRSAYGFNTSRDGRRRDFDRSRHEDRYYQSQRPSHAGSTSGDVTERATSERDYRTGRDPRYDMYSRDPRDPYYQHPSYNYYRGAYDPYRQYPPGYNYYSIDYQMKYAAWIEEMKKNPAAYSEWYQRTYGQRYTPSVTTGPGTAAGSIAASEADRASVHSGRSSVNEEPNQMSQAIRGSTTGLEQQGLLDYSVFPDEERSVAISHQDLTPHKYSSAHTIARFSAGGLLCRVLPNNPKEGTAAYVELHDLNVLLEDLPSIQDFKYFPGPLIPGQTHKQQVMVFCQQKIRLALLEESKVAENDRASYILLWEFLLLLLRQNGTVVGTDIAELLLKDHEILKEPLLQDFDTADQTVTDRSLVSRQSEASITKRFRELLLFGNKKEALEWAMSQGLWGHALFLASKMDQRTYSSVMIRFANGLALNDPLQTLYQLMSGRQPASVTNCGDDKWGDWRPHLAMILSNSTSKPELDKKSIVSLGDSLAAKGYVLAAHFCYLVAQVEFGDYSNKSSKLVLLSSSTAQPFDKFATNEALQCTEVYEYVRQLASPEFVIPSFQSYKFLYATRLAEHGRAAEALQYCEVVGNVMAKNPSTYPLTLVSRVYEFGSMLKFHDPQYQTENDGAPFTDPAWLTALVAASQSDPPSLSSVPQVHEVIQSPAEDSAAQSAQQPAFYEQSSQQQQQQQQPEYQSYTDHTASPVHQPQLQSQLQPQYYDQTDSLQYQPQQQSQHQPFYERQDSSQYLQPQPTSLQSYGSEEDKQQSRLASAELDQSSGQYGSLSGQGYNYQSYGQADSWQSNSGYGDQQSTPAFYTQSGSGPESHDYWRNSSLPTGGNDEEGSGRNSFAAGDASSASNSQGGPTAAGGKKEGAKSTEDKDDKDKSASSSSSGWLGGLFSWKKNPKSNHPVPMKLPDDKNPRIVWDDTLKRWVDTEKKDGDDSMAPPPPPPMVPVMGPVPSASTNTPSPTGSLSAAPPALNLRANLRGRTGLNKYVNNGTIATKSVESAGMSFLDPFTGSNAGSTVTSPVGPGLGAPMIFTPTPSAGPAAGAAPMDFVSAPASGPQSAPDSLPPQAAEPSGPFMYNPSQFAATAAPSSAAGRGGLRRYPR